MNVGLPSQRDHSPEQKRRLLKQLLQKKASQMALVPLSAVQERLWFIEHLQEGSLTYNILAAARLIGELRIEALRESLCQVIRRHEALRTVFVLDDGVPVQHVAPEPVVQLELRDLRAWPEEERETEARRQALVDAGQPFDLQHGPLLRTLVLRLSADVYLLFLHIHHLIADGWSSEIILRELSAFYSAEVSGQKITLPAQAVQYRDFVRWQQKRGDEWAGHLAYWREQLQGYEPLQLPASAPRAISLAPTRGGRQWRLLPAPLLGRLQALGQSEGATLYMTLFSAFSLLLARYSSSEDLVIGTPSAGRDHRAFENVVGFFVNMLPLRVNLAGQPSFRAVLRRARQTVLDAYTHQDVPFEKIVEAVSGERDLTRNPLFQVQFAFQHVTLQNLQLAGLTIKPYQLHNGTSKFDLSLFAWEEHDRLMTSLEYNAEIFSAEIIERMLAHLHVLLEQIVEQPDRPWMTLALLSPAEYSIPAGSGREQGENAGAQAGSCWEQGLCLHEIFARQARLHPDATALVYEQSSLSYTQLEQRANALAAHLQKLGVGLETPVAICLERSPELLIALLGVLKVGGMYVPLDPAYPQERLRYILQDARATVLLSERCLLESLPEYNGTLCLLDELDLTQADVSWLPGQSAKPENAAYVIYTSGSTGQPKGVVVTHQNVLSLFAATWNWYRFDERDTWSFFHSFAFDFSVWEIWGALLYGGRLVIVPYLVSRSPEAFYTLLNEQQVTVLNQTPSAFYQLIQVEDDLEETRLPSLRAVIFGGEALDPARLQNWFVRHGYDSPRLINMYGITETTVHVSYCSLTPALLESGAGASVIGGPIPGWQIYLLDSYMQPVPPGVPGEIYVGGNGLARGYLNRADLTAERFVPHPFSQETGATLYKTGDQARQRADGSLEYLGRLDTQVKIRGFRIELGEIEARLLQHARQAVVIAREDVPGDQRLVAYLVLRPGQELYVEELRQALARDLPAYMLPADFVALEQLPLTRNGKIDRQALPAPARSVATSELAPAISGTLVEDVVQTIWGHLLQRAKPGIHENFFALGGHSLLASRVMTHIRAAFQIDLPVRSLFEAPTIARLSAKVEETLLQGKSAAETLPLCAETYTEPIPLSLAQQRLWFLEQLESELPLYNIPLLVRLQGELNGEALQEALKDVVRRHASLRTTVGDGEHGPVQILHNDLWPTWEWLDLADLDQDAQSRALRALAEQEQRWRFDLQRGPLLRVKSIHLATADHALLLNLHHLVADGWSLQLLLAEWETCYAARLRGEEAQLPQLELQYVDYTRWQRRNLANGRLAAQENYWRKQLADAPAALLLPTEKERGQATSKEGASASFALDAELVERLRQFSQQEGATLYMTLLAAYQLLLSSYSRQKDLVVGTPVGQRGRIELECMIGFLVNILPVRLDLSGNPSVRELLRRVRQITLEAYTHQDLPFERIVELTGGERNPTHTPVFQVVFVYEQTAAWERPFANLNLRQIDIPNTVAKFELALVLNESSAGVRGAFNYQQDLYSAEMVQAMCAQYEHLLRALLVDPERSINTLELLPPEEYQRVVRQWNETASAYDGDLSVPQRIAMRAAFHPESLAIEGPAEGQRLTYEELNTRANQLARYVHRRTDGAEALIAVCAERSPELVLAELAALKAGAAYVPLDPALPLARLSAILADIQPRVVLTRLHLVELLQTALAGVTADVLALDENQASCWQEDSSELSLSIEPDQLAYVIYTSGSTGQPKGVQVAHRGLVNFIDWHQRAFQITARDRSAQMASVGFDGTIAEIWPVLCAGATLVFSDEQTRYSPEILQSWFVEQKITLSFTPTPMAEMLLALPWPVETSLRYLHTAGDQLHSFSPPALPFVLVNHYGPTENTVEATQGNVPTSDHALPGERPSIGRPLANVEVYVLDDALRPVPPEVPGELYLGGIALARGYLHRPDLTAERFVPHPFSTVPGARLYRTGDVCSFYRDGRLRFIGRNDRQVKLRGYRIELGEIEAHLQQQAGVSQAAVVVHTLANEQKSLVAYLVPAPGQALDVNEIRRAMRAGLPEYMVPSFLIVLETLPLASSGKLDRKALPTPDVTEMAREQVYLAPRTTLEQQLVAIWQEVLEREHVGVNENFFDLGGHSLSMAQVHRKLQETLQRKVALLDLFQYPTIQFLASYLEQAQSARTLQARGGQTQESKQRLRNLRQRQNQLKGAK